jgi:MFS transporter, DHA1 family, tetracycline resistance protein
MKRVYILPIFLTAFMDTLGFSIVLPVVSPLFLDPAGGLFPASFDMSSRTIMLGLLIAIYPIAQFFGAPILGGLSDWHGRKRLLMLAETGAFLGYILFAAGVASHNISLLFGSLLIGGFMAGNASIINSIIADISDEKTKARNFGLSGMALGTGYIIGPFIGGKLTDSSIVSWFNYSTPFWFSACLSLITLALIAVYLRETIRHRVHTQVSMFSGTHNVVSAFRTRKLKIMFLVILLLALGFNFFAQFFQVYLINKFHYTPSQIGDTFAYMGVWIALSQGVINRQLSHKFTPNRILAFSSMCLAWSLFMLVLPMNTPYLYIVLAFVSVFEGLVIPNLMTLVSDLGDARSQGRVLGINQSINSVCMAVPPVISGVIVAYSINLPVLVSSALTVVGGLVFILMFQEKAPKA